MATHGDVKKGEAVILYTKSIGYVRAWALEDSPDFGALAHFRVRINSTTLPGIEEATINVNTWDVYPEDDVEVLKKILNAHVPHQYVR